MASLENTWDLGYMGYLQWWPFTWYTGYPIPLYLGIWGLTIYTSEVSLAKHTTTSLATGNGQYLDTSGTPGIWYIWDIYSGAPLLYIRDIPYLFGGGIWGPNIYTSGVMRSVNLRSNICLRGTTSQVGALDRIAMESLVPNIYGISTVGALYCIYGISHTST